MREYPDEIYTKISDANPNPRIPCDSDKEYIKHVHCSDARFHVTFWAELNTYCSEPDCIINKPKEESK